MGVADPCNQGVRTSRESIEHRRLTDRSYTEAGGVLSNDGSVDGSEPNSSSSSAGGNSTSLSTASNSSSSSAVSANDEYSRAEDSRSDSVKKEDDSTEGVLGATTTGGLKGDCATDTVPVERDKLEGVVTSGSEASDGGSEGTGVMEGSGEAATSEVKAEGEGGIVLSLSKEDTEDALDALGRRKDVSYEASGTS